MENKKKFLAVAGAGGWGKNHVRNFYELGALHTVCDLSPSILQSCVEQYKKVHITPSFNDILANREIKAVVLATPSPLHYSMAKEALQHNKDVFVEKPLSLNVSEAEELRDIAKSRKRILMVGHILQYHPAMLKLHELVKQGALGKIYYVYSSRLNYGKFRTNENILWSFAPHDVSLILMLLGEEPVDVASFGGYYLHPNKADTTMTVMQFPSGVSVHIFVSWLHPFKEQKLVVAGSECMAVFDDVQETNKLMLYRHSVDWVERVPLPKKDAGEPVPFDDKEPLREECEHFLHCVKKRQTPRTDAEEGIRVLRILTLCQRSLESKSNIPASDIPNERQASGNGVFIHPTAIVDARADIGRSTRIWHFSHVMKNASIGENCVIGQNVFIGANVKIGNKVKIQNNVSVYTGVRLDDEVFCGPSCVFTNVMNPRSAIERKNEFMPTHVKKGATLGANCSIVCGVTIGEYAFVGAGAVVTKDVLPYALVYGSPARRHGWVCKCGAVLKFARTKVSECPSCGKRYKEEKGKMRDIS